MLCHGTAALAVDPPVNPVLTTAWQALLQQLSRVLPPHDLAT
jgi:hypothetical protein